MTSSGSHKPMDVRVRTPLQACGTLTYTPNSTQKHFTIVKCGHPTCLADQVTDLNESTLTPWTPLLCSFHGLEPVLFPFSAQRPWSLQRGVGVGPEVSLQAQVREPSLGSVHKGWTSHRTGLMSILF